MVEKYNCKVKINWKSFKKKEIKHNKLKSLSLIIVNDKHLFILVSESVKGLILLLTSLYTQKKIRECE